MSGIARMRLREERKQWRKEHKWGFYARETQNEDGTKNIFKWEAGIPGKEKVGSIDYLPFESVLRTGELMSLHVTLLNCYHRAALLVWADEFENESWERVEFAGSDFC